METGQEVCVLRHCLFPCSDCQLNCRRRRSLGRDSSSSSSSGNDAFVVFSRRRRLMPSEQACNGGGCERISSLFSLRYFRSETEASRGTRQQPLPQPRAESFRLLSVAPSCPSSSSSSSSLSHSHSLSIRSRNPRRRRCRCKHDV